MPLYFPQKLPTRTLCFPYGTKTSFANRRLLPNSITDQLYIPRRAFSQLVRLRRLVNNEISFVPFLFSSFLPSLSSAAAIQLYFSVVAAKKKIRVFYLEKCLKKFKLSTMRRVNRWFKCQFCWLNNRWPIPLLFIVIFRCHSVTRDGERKSAFYYCWIVQQEDKYFLPKDHELWHCYQRLTSNSSGADKKNGHFEVGLDLWILKQKSHPQSGFLSLCGLIIELRNQLCVLFKDSIYWTVEQWCTFAFRDPKLLSELSNNFVEIAVNAVPRSNSSTSIANLANLAIQHVLIGFSSSPVEGQWGSKTLLVARGERAARKWKSDMGRKAIGFVG